MAECMRGDVNVGFGKPVFGPATNYHDIGLRNEIRTERQLRAHKREVNSNVYTQETVNTFAETGRKEEDRRRRNESFGTSAWLSECIIAHTTIAARRLLSAPEECTSGIGRADSFFPARSQKRTEHAHLIPGPVVSAVKQTSVTFSEHKNLRRSSFCRDPTSRRTRKCETINKV